MFSFLARFFFVLKSETHCRDVADTLLLQYIESNPKSLFYPPQDTGLIGKKVVYLPKCRSTNDELARMLTLQPVGEGTVVICSEQTAGRGQRGNAWEAQPDANLTLSILLRPDFLKASEQFALNMALSLALVDTLNGLTGGLALKWPNDLYAKGGKLGGMLIENYLKASRLDVSVCGIGLNVNQRAFANERAVSLAALTGKDYHLPTLFAELLRAVEGRYLQLKARRDLRREYYDRLLGYHETRPFQDLRYGDPRPFEGQIIGTDDYGRLAVKVAEKVERFAFKEVAFVF